MRRRFVPGAVLGVLLCLLALAGCSPADLLNATVPDGDGTVQRDVPYAPGHRHTQDIYRPARPAGPLVVFLYGGGWTSGDKDMYAFVARPLSRLGIVVTVPDYRVAPEVQWPGFLDDNAAAVAWAVAHAAELGADPRRVFVVGHSAGAYNALMLATDPGFLQRAGTSRDRLAGVVGLAGPYDFLPSDDRQVLAAFGPANLAQNQPVAHVDGHAPPLLLLAGTADETVRPRNTVELARRVQAAGGDVQSRLYPGLGHIGLVTAFAPLFAKRAPVLDDVWTFVSRQHPAGP